MAKKARNRRSGRVARQKERLESLQTKVDSGLATDDEKALLEEMLSSDADVGEDAVEAIAEGSAKAAEEDVTGDDARPIELVRNSSSDDGDGKPVVRHKSALRRYLDGVRLEMRRVTWPDKPEMVKYSVSTIAALLLTGGAVWAIDNGFIAGIIAFSGLRP